MTDLHLDENKQTELLFDLQELLVFQLKYSVEIIRGSDYMYQCYIDKKCYSVSMTPLNAFVMGVKNFKEIKNGNV